MQLHKPFIKKGQQFETVQEIYYKSNKLNNFQKILLNKNFRDVTFKVWYLTWETWEFVENLFLAGLFPTNLVTFEWERHFPQI